MPKMMIEKQRKKRIILGKTTPLFFHIQPFNQNHHNHHYIHNIILHLEVIQLKSLSHSFTIALSFTLVYFTLDTHTRNIHSTIDYDDNDD